MNAEIISIGTELLLGHTINTDAAYVARELSALGIGLYRTTVVGDNAARLEAALTEALAACDLVITTGGLGPTDDDLTKETVARVTKAPLEEHAESMARLREYFGTRPMGANQRKQAWLPHGATVFSNYHGTAPGCSVPVGDKKVILLPGPPSELLPMLREQVVPFLMQQSEGVIASCMIRTFGIGEGPAAQKISELTGAANPSTATYATDGEMFVRVTAKAKDAKSAERLARPVIDRVRELLGDVVYGIDVDCLESVVVPELIRRGITLATAESCTGGLLAKRLTDQPGVSAIYGAGLVTYSNEAKNRLLGVPKSMLARHGAVSEQVARRMAEGVRKKQGSMLGVGITGIAGPDGATATKPVGLVYIALSDGEKTFVREMRPRGRYMGRGWTRERAASHALDMIRRYLFGLPPDMAE